MTTTEYLLVKAFNATTYLTGNIKYLLDKTDEEITSNEVNVDNVFVTIREIDNKLNKFYFMIEFIANTLGDKEKLNTLQSIMDKFNGDIGYYMCNYDTYVMYFLYEMYVELCKSNYKLHDIVTISYDTKEDAK